MQPVGAAEIAPKSPLIRRTWENIANCPSTGSGRTAKYLNFCLRHPFVVSLSNHERIFSQLPLLQRENLRPGAKYWVPELVHIAAVDFRPWDNFPRILARLSPSASKRILRLVRNAPAPDLARNNLARLIEASGLKTFQSVPAGVLPTLITLLGSSSYLSDVLIRRGKDWPDFFSQQVSLPKKPAQQHLRELNSAVQTARDPGRFHARPAAA